jgi:hypothetical protein
LNSFKSPRRVFLLRWSPLRFSKRPVPPKLIKLNLKNPSNKILDNNKLKSQVIKKSNVRISRSNTKFSEQVSTLEDPDEESLSLIGPSDASPEKKKDKKLVFLSRSVLQSVREYP